MASLHLCKSFSCTVPDASVSHWMCPFSALQQRLPASPRLAPPRQGRHGLLTREMGLLLLDFPWPMPCGLSLPSQWVFQLPGQTSRSDIIGKGSCAANGGPTPQGRMPPGQRGREKKNEEENQPRGGLTPLQRGPHLTLARSRKTSKWVTSWWHGQCRDAGRDKGSLKPSMQSPQNTERGGNLPLCLLLVPKV